MPEGIVTELPTGTQSASTSTNRVLGNISAQLGNDHPITKDLKQLGLDGYPIRWLPDAAGLKIPENSAITIIPRVTGSTIPSSYLILDEGQSQIIRVLENRIGPRSQRDLNEALNRKQPDQRTSRHNSCMCLERQENISNQAESTTHGPRNRFGL